MRFITKIYADRIFVFVHLNDGTVVNVRRDKFPRLRNATVDAVRSYELLADGTAVHWPDIDEDISLDGFLRNAAYVTRPQS